LTPPVELSVSQNDTNATALLEWTVFEGSTPFAAYRVLRKVPELAAVDTLAVIEDVGQVTFIDSTMMDLSDRITRAASP